MLVCPGNWNNSGLCVKRAAIPNQLISGFCYATAAFNMRVTSRDLMLNDIFIRL